MKEDSEEMIMIDGLQYIINHVGNGNIILIGLATLFISHYLNDKDEKEMIKYLDELINERVEDKK